MALKKNKKLKVKVGKNKNSSSNKPQVGKSIKSVGKSVYQAAKTYAPDLVSLSENLGVGKAVSNLKTKMGKGSTGKKRRKGKIPKQVKRWASRIVSRRKQEEKLVKELFGAGGGKVVKAPKKGSAGVITREEALRSLRN